MANRADDVVSNPCERWMEFKNGEIVEYDKTTEKNIVHSKPFTFIVLEDLSTIKGFHTDLEIGIYSNEVRNLKEEILNVRTKKDTIATGYYDDIKETIKAKGGKFNKSIYIMFKDSTGKMVMGNLMIGGSALAGGKLADKVTEVPGYMEFSTKFRGDILKKSVKVLKEVTECKKGSNVYNVPNFAIQEITPETNQEAIEMAKTIREYLNKYLHDNLVKYREFIKNQEALTKPPANAPAGNSRSNEEPKMSNHEAIMGTPEPRVESQVVDNEPIDDLPF
jgi:hypothetical protein